MSSIFQSYILPLPIFEQVEFCHKLHSACISTTSKPIFLNQVVLESPKWELSIYIGYKKATTNNWDIRPSAAIKTLSANISWMAEYIRTIELALESAHQTACTQTITLLYIYLRVWGLDLRLNNINYPC